MVIKDTKRVTGACVAAFFGVTQGSVTRWAPFGCPRNKDTTYDLQKVVAWREKWKIDSALEKQENSKPSDALDRLRVAKAKREEIRLEKDQGALILKDEVDTMLVERWRAIKQSLQRLPKQLSVRFAAMSDRFEIENILRDRLAAACNRMSKKGEK